MGRSGWREMGIARTSEAVVSRVGVGGQGSVGIILLSFSENKILNNEIIIMMKINKNTIIKKKERKKKKKK